MNPEQVFGSLNGQWLQAVWFVCGQFFAWIRARIWHGDSSMACLKETIRADMQLAAELKAALCTPDYVMKDSGGGGGGWFGKVLLCQPCKKAMLSNLNVKANIVWTGHTDHFKDSETYPVSSSSGLTTLKYPLPCKRSHTLLGTLPDSGCRPVGDDGKTTQLCLGFSSSLIQRGPCLWEGHITQTWSYQGYAYFDQWGKCATWSSVTQKCGPLNLPGLFQMWIGLPNFAHA